MSSSTAQPDQDAHAVWTRGDLRTDPHQMPDKARRVQRMFASIAPIYDFNNRLHSFGRDQHWRRAAVRLAQVTPSDEALDVACGTGDLTRALADAGAGHVTGLDFTPEMLDIARSKRLTRRHAPRDAVPVIDYVEGDALKLLFDDQSFDIVSIGFGIRNVADPPLALREFHRVLRPGGRLIILEFSRPRFPPVALGYHLFCNVIMPRTATLISGDRSGAYHYLPRSINTFLSPDQMREALTETGFTGVRTRYLTLGVCAAVRAVRP